MGPTPFTNGSSLCVLAIFTTSVILQSCAGRSIRQFVLDSYEPRSDQDQTIPQTLGHSPPPYLPEGCYVGCFGDHADGRALPNMYEEADDMTVDRCREAARAQGYVYFGVEAGRQCFAGNDLLQAHAFGLVDMCDYRCAGNYDQICGGNWAISIYRSYDPEPAPPAPDPPSPMRPPPFLRRQDLVGCYRDSEGHRALPILLELSNYMTVASCRMKAEETGVQLYGVEAGRECWGGTDVQRATYQGSSLLCNRPCGGDDCEVCGGDWAILIFMMPPTVPALAPFLPESPPVESTWPIGPLQPPPTAPQITGLYPPTVSYPPVYSMPPVYASPQTPPASAGGLSFLLPERLRPGSAYFDASCGISNYADPYYEEGIVMLWKDVFVSDRPGNLLYFSGTCRYSPEKEPGTPAVRFDGMSCGSVMDGPLPDWDASASGAFTAVWISRTLQDDSGREQVIMTISRTPDDFDRQLYWTSKQAFAYCDETGYSVNVSLRAPPPGQWTMQVMSRSPEVGSPYVRMSFFSYGWLDTSTFDFSGPGCPLDPDHFAIGLDYRDHDKAFRGDVAVVLMYNKALSSSEIQDLVDFYRPRFGWERPTEL